MIETIQYYGDTRVIEQGTIIQVAFRRRVTSPDMSPADARALAKMLNAAARRIEGRKKAEQKSSRKLRDEQGSTTMPLLHPDGYDRPDYKAIARQFTAGDSH